MRYRSIFLLAALLSLCLFALISHVSVTNVSRKFLGLSATPTVQTSHVSSVTGEIIAIKSSPDFSLAALVVALDKDGRNSEILLFDPLIRTIVARCRLHYTNPRLAWSPDSHRLAIYSPLGEKSVTLLDSNGAVRTLETHEIVHYLIWYGRSNDKFLYYFDRSDKQVYLYDLNGLRERVLISGYQIVGLSCVDGKPCMAYLQRNREKPDYAWPGVQVMDIEKRKILLTVPFLSQWDKGCDDYFLDLSPDGQYFRLDQAASGYAQTIIADCADARVVLQKKRYAIYFHGGAGFVPPIRPCWSPFFGQGLAGEEAMLPRGLLYLPTGNISCSDEFPYYDMHVREKVFDYWKTPRTFLYANNEGLHLSCDDLAAPALLRHSVW